MTTIFYDAHEGRWTERRCLMSARLGERRTHNIGWIGCTNIPSITTTRRPKHWPFPQSINESPPMSSCPSIPLIPHASRPRPGSHSQSNVPPSHRVPPPASSLVSRQACMPAFHPPPRPSILSNRTNSSYHITPHHTITYVQRSTHNNMLILHTSYIWYVYTQRKHIT